MINKQYSITQAPDYWADIIKRVEQGYSIKLTHNSEVVAMLVPAQYDEPPPKQNFWQALQIFRQQVDIAELYDEDIFSEVRDRSPGREVLL
jgi:antitoxin (DNA-binding transcriptional repressor) of toxin-antitoxin stability system